MRRVFLATIVVAGLMAAAPVFAEPTTGATSGTTTASGEPAKPAKPVKTSDTNRMVCTRELVVGSNRPEKVCMTVAERERIRDASRRAIEGNLGSGAQNTGGARPE